MNVSVDDIKKLRELTGVGLTDAKKALMLRGKAGNQGEAEHLGLRVDGQDGQAV